MTSFVATKTAATNPSDVLVAQFISDPLQAQTISAAGFVKGIIRVLENLLTVDARAQMTVRVLSSDGATVRGTLLAFDAAALSNEFDSVSLTNRRFPLNWAGSGAALTQVIASDGDVIVVEVGARFHTANTGDTCTLRFGDASATDLLEDETGTIDDNPWIEFSQTLLFDETTERRGADQANFTEAGNTARPAGGPVSMVSRTLSMPLPAEAASRRRSRGTDFTTRLGLGLGHPQGGAESYGSEKFLRLTSGDFESVRTPDSPALPVTVIVVVVPPNAVAPLVSNVSPPTGTPIARSAPVFFDVTDDSGLFRRVIVTATFQDKPLNGTYVDGTVEVVHDGDTFSAAYGQGALRTLITNGFHYRVQRVGGWPFAPTIRAYAIDQSGNENS